MRIETLRKRLAEAGLSGAFLVRELGGGREIGIDPEAVYPVASLVKVPLAVAVLDRIHAGKLDGAMMIDVPPGPPPTGFEAGLSQFRHAARIAVDDLLYLAVAISDNPAADALFDLVPPAEVTEVLRGYGIGGIVVRHPMRELSGTPTDANVAQTLAIGAREAELGNGLPQLDVTRANIGSARAYVDLLEALWTPSAIPGPVAERIRHLMRANIMRHRLGPDFMSDASIWSSKTGTLLNLRHEVGVVEHEDGSAFAVAALTESSVPAASQPAAEALMGHVARALHDLLRD
ncbi:MAG TPA: serine hydrolase [Actinospica sp.]|jgi:beta-lactamase class A|nr:serine hydrolase [Actinospica sp.]